MTTQGVFRDFLPPRRVIASVGEVVKCPHCDAMLHCVYSATEELGATLGYVTHIRVSKVDDLFITRRGSTGSI